MLEGLSAVDWESLTHAYGPAGGIPNLIRALTSLDPEVWVGAMDSLYATLCHQSCTVYEATPPAIPFLIELLGSKQVRCRARILEFLADSARATSYLDAHGLPSDDDEQEAEATPEERARELEQLARELEWVSRARQAVWSGLDVYLDLMIDLDKRLRIASPYALGRLIEHAFADMPDAVGGRAPLPWIEEKLSRQVNEEPNDLVRASLVFGLSRLAPHRPGIVQKLEQLAGDPAGPVALGAAICLADLPGTTPPKALEVLLGALREPDRTNRLFDAGEMGMEKKHHPVAKGYRRLGAPLDDEAGTGFDTDDLGSDEDFRFPWLDEWTTTVILQRVARAGPAHLDRVIPLVTPYLDRASDITCESVAGPILRLVFGEGEAAGELRPEGLSTAQAEVLRHLYDNLGLWATDCGNVGLTFDRFGLPEDRESWAQLLGIEQVPPDKGEIVAILQRLAPQQQFTFLGPEIRRLNLRAIGTPAFLPHLTQFPDLENLDLSGIAIADADLIHLRSLPKLKQLQIPNSSVTDEGVKVLCTLRNLQVLNVSGTRITDVGLKALSSLENLQSLSLSGVLFSVEAIRKFKKKRPKCRVYR